MIYISSNEPDTIKYGLTWHQEPKIKAMDTGDIMLYEKGRIMLIERKGAPDLLNSMSDGRLVDQGSRLVAECDLPLLLTHGSLLCNKEGKVVANGRTSKWPWWSLQMQLVSLQAGGLMWLHVQRTQDLPEAIKYLSEWLVRDSHLHVSKREKIPFLVPEKEVQILASFPGLGTSKAVDCLNHYGSAGRAIAELTCEEKCLLPKGVAGGTVKKIRNALGLREGERLVMEWTEEK